MLKQAAAGVKRLSQTSVMKRIAVIMRSEVATREGTRRRVATLLAARSLEIAAEEGISDVDSAGN